jgi:hypothetical protein
LGAAVFTDPNPPSLPKNLQLGKPSYSYGNQAKYTLTFPTDIERALFQATKKTPTSKDLLYRQWLRDLGLSDQEIESYGTDFRAQLKQQVQTAMKTGPNKGLLTVARFSPGGIAAPAPAPTTAPVAPAPAPTTAPATPAPTGVEPTPFGMGAEPGTTPGTVPFTQQQTKTKTTDLGSSFEILTQAPGQASSKISISKDSFNKLEGVLPGSVRFMQELHSRLFPGMELVLVADLGSSRGSSLVMSPKKVRLAINPTVLEGEFGTGPNRQTKMLHTMFHELSHAIEQVYLIKAPPSVLSEIVKQYVRSRNPNAARRAAIVMSLIEGRAGSDPKLLTDLVHSAGIDMNTYQQYVSSKSKVLPKGILQSYVSGELRDDYYRSFTEWVAEQGAAWLAKESKGLVPKTTFEKFQKAILDRLRKLYEEIAKTLGIPSRKGEFEKYMESVYGKQTEVSAIQDVVVGPDIIYYSDPGSYTQGMPKKKKAKTKKGTWTYPEGQRPLQFGEEASAIDVDAARAKIFAATPDQRGAFRKFVDRVQEMYKEGGWQALADAFSREVVDRYIHLKRLDDRFVAAMKKLGIETAAAYDQRMSIAARNSAHASMLDRENTLAKLNTLLFQGGVPVYVSKDPNNPLDGIIKIEGKGGGLTFLKDLQKSGKLMNWAEYAVARRVLGSYQEKGLEFQLTPAEAQAIVDLHGQDPDIVNAYNQYQEFNKAVIKLAVDSGRLAEKDAAELLKYMDYFPFYRFVDDSGRYTGPINSKGLLSPGKIMKAQGGTELLQGDPVDMILKNTQFWLSASQKNIAARKIYTMSQARTGCS